MKVYVLMYQDSQYGEDDFEIHVFENRNKAEQEYEKIRQAIVEWAQDMENDGIDDLIEENDDFEIDEDGIILSFAVYSEDNDDEIGLQRVNLSIQTIISGE